MLQIRPETVSRWNQGKAFPRPEAERILLDLEYVVERLADSYEPAPNATERSPVMVHELSATMDKMFKLARAHLIDLGVLEPVRRHQLRTHASYWCQRGSLVLRKRHRQLHFGVFN